MTLICITLNDETIEGMFNTGVKGKTKGADLLEFRLDFLKEPINDALLTELLHLNKQIGLSGIITYRPAWDGGKFEGTEDSRLEIIEKCISLGFDYVDLELKITNEKLFEIITNAKEHQVKTIVSYHDFQNTPEQDKILEKLKQCITAGGDIAKVVYNCKTYDEGLNILKAGSMANKQNLSFTVMGMGEFGSVTRILSPAIGCKIVYVSIDENSYVIEGQVDFETLKESWEILGYK